MALSKVETSGIEDNAVTSEKIVSGGTDLTTDVTGTLPIANGGTGATTAAGARTTLGVDAAGTDNSTDVTLAGTPDYLTLSGQEITLGQVDLAADVTGVLPTANGGTGQDFSATTGAVYLNSGTATAVDMTTKGTLLVGDGTTTPSALAVGTNDYVLTADSAQGTGMKWAAAGGGNTATLVAGNNITAGDAVVLLSDGKAYRPEGLIGPKRWREDNNWKLSTIRRDTGAAISPDPSLNASYDWGYLILGFHKIPGATNKYLQVGLRSENYNYRSNFQLQAFICTYNTTTKQLDFGTPVVFPSGSSGDALMAYDGGTQKCILSYDQTNSRWLFVGYDQSNSAYLSSWVLTVSGDTITVNTPSILSTSANYSSTKAMNMAWDAYSSRWFLVYENSTDSANYWNGFSGSYGSATSASWSSRYDVSSLPSNGSPHVDVDYGMVDLIWDETNSRLVCVWTTTFPQLNVAVITVNAGSVTFGTAAVNSTNSLNTMIINAQYVPEVGGIVVISHKWSSNTGNWQTISGFWIWQFTCSGTTVTKVLEDNSISSGSYYLPWCTKSSYHTGIGGSKKFLLPNPASTGREASGTGSYIFYTWTSHASGTTYLESLPITLGAGTFSYTYTNINDGQLLGGGEHQYATNPVNPDAYYYQGYRLNRWLEIDEDENRAILIGGRSGISVTSATGTQGIHYWIDGPENTGTFTYVGSANPASTGFYSWYHVIQNNVLGIATTTATTGNPVTIATGGNIYGTASIDGVSSNVPGGYVIVPGDTITVALDGSLTKRSNNTNPSGLNSKLYFSMYNVYGTTASARIGKVLNNDPASASIITGMPLGL